MSKKTFIAFGCTHIPHYDREYAENLIGQIRERKPDLIICLGDLLDTGAISIYPKTDVVKLGRECEEADKFLNAINDAAPKAHKVFMEGNHEERIWRPDQSAISTMLDFRKHIKSLRPWKYYSYIENPRYTYRTGQLTFWHGNACTKSGVTEDYEGIDLSGPKECAHGCYIHAHTHRPCEPGALRANARRLPFWRCNVGCGIDFKWVQQDYAKKRNISQWQHAFIWGWHETKRRYDGQPNWDIELITGKSAWGE